MSKSDNRDNQSSISQNSTNYSQSPKINASDINQQFIKPERDLPKWVVFALIGLFLLGLLTGWFISRHKSVAHIDQASKQTMTNRAEAVLTINTISPSYEEVENTLAAEGTIQAKSTAKVSGKINGVVVEQVFVDVGDTVKKGQVLARFDSDGLQQQLLQAEAGLAEAQAMLANATANAKRILPLLKIDAISQQEADRYQTAKIQAQASVQSATARLKNQRMNLNNATVIAPVSGIVSERFAQVGSVANGSPLFSIIVNGNLQWQANLDPNYLNEIFIGMPVKVSLGNAQSIIGKVSRIAPSADGNRQISVFVDLQADSNLKAGMFQQGEFLLGKHPQQTINQSAIVSSDGYDYVMVVSPVEMVKTKSKDQDGSFTLGQITKQKIKIRQYLGDRAILAQALPDDIKLVKQGGGFLKNGDIVRVANSPIINSLNSQNDNK